MSEYITSIAVFYEAPASNGMYAVSAAVFTEKHGSPLPYEIISSMPSSGNAFIASAKRGRLSIWTDQSDECEKLISNLSSAELNSSIQEGETAASMFISAFLLSTDGRDDFYQRNRSKINDFWDRGDYKNVQRIGRVMDAIGHLAPGATFSEWIDLYTTRCLGWEGIYNEVARLSKLEGFTINQGLQIWWKRVIDNSFKGWDSERKVLAKLVERAATMDEKVKFIKPSAYQDRNEGVDFIAIDDKTGEVKFGIQVKVGHYVRSSSPRIMEAKRKDTLKYERFSKNNGGARVWIVAIDEVLADSNDWKLRKPEGVR